MQRIILQKSAEWTPKKSKKKLREDGTANEEDATPGSAKIRKSSVKKSKLSKVVEGDCDDEHSDANILLLLSASKSPALGSKIKMSKSPSKRALKTSSRDAVQQQSNDSSVPPSSSSSSPQKIKRLNKPYAGSVSNGLPSTLESGSMDRKTEVCLWSPGGLVKKGKMQTNAGDIDYLSPRPGSKYYNYHRL